MAAHSGVLPPAAAVAVVVDEVVRVVVGVVVGVVVTAVVEVAGANVGTLATVVDTRIITGVHDAAYGVLNTDTPNEPPQRSTATNRRVAFIASVVVCKVRATEKKFTSHTGS
jgi:hypothetical protein